MSSKSVQRRSSLQAGRKITTTGTNTSRPDADGHNGTKRNEGTRRVPGALEGRRNAMSTAYRPAPEDEFVSDDEPVVSDAAHVLFWRFMSGRICFGSSTTFCSESFVTRRVLVSWV